MGIKNFMKTYNIVQLYTKISNNNSNKSPGSFCFHIKVNKVL